MNSGRIQNENQILTPGKEELFELELLKFEKFRSLFIALLFIVFSILYIIFSLFLHQNFALRFHGQLPRWHFPLFFLVIAGIEIVSHLLLRGPFRKDRLLRRVIRYITGMIEVTIPTISIFILSRAVNPFEAILGPPGFLYFVFLLLGILNLDFRFSVIQGFYSGAQFYFIGQYLLKNQMESALVSPYLQGIFLPKGMLLLATGIAAGFMSREIRKRIRLEDTIRKISKKSEHYLLSFKGEDRWIPFASIEYISAAGRKTLFHTDGGDFETNTYIGEIARSLPEEFFFQVHRSFIVSLNRVESLERSGGEFILHLTDDSETIPVSRRRARILKEKMNQQDHS